MEQVAESYTADNAFMGTVLVTHGDQVLLNKGFGMAVLEWNIPNMPDTKFRLGSLTKQFTAALVSMGAAGRQTQYQRSCKPVST